MVTIRKRFQCKNYNGNIKQPKNSENIKSDLTT